MQHTSLTENLKWFGRVGEIDTGGIVRSEFWIIPERKKYFDVFRSHEHELHCINVPGSLSVNNYRHGRVYMTDVSGVTELGRLQALTIGRVSVSRYTARLRAIGADLGTGH